jgi:hypothetical protein
MKLAEFEKKFENYELEDAYAEYIMENSKGERTICNGDMLIVAMEDGYMYESFKESLVTE